MGVLNGHEFTNYCQLHGVTSADCVKVTTPLDILSISSAGAVSPYIAVTTTYTLSDPTNIGFAQIPITRMGYVNGQELNSHTYFIEHYQSCVDQYTFPTPRTSTKQTSTTMTKQKSKTTTQETVQSASRNQSSTVSKQSSVAAAQQTGNVHSSRDGGLSHGAKVALGASIGAVVVCLIVLTLVYRAARRCRKGGSRTNH